LVFLTNDTNRGSSSLASPEGAQKVNAVNRYQKLDTPPLRLFKGFEPRLNGFVAESRNGLFSENRGVPVV
jgi:hypothetical protein